MLTEVLERALDRNLQRSPRARELCAALAGRRFAVEVTASPWSVTVESLGRSLRLLPAGRADQDPREPDARVSGSLLALLELAGSDPQAVLRRGAARMSGDTEVAQQFRELAALLRPDVEEELSRFVGDAPAHHAVRAVRLALGFARRGLVTTVRNAAEYLSHERGDLVPRAEAESLFKGVEALREDVDRIEARLAVLAAGRAATGNGP